MKKLVATLAAVIFCIGAGIEFVGPKEDGFTLSTKEYQAYWSPGDSGEMSAADLYRLMYGTTDSTKPVCETEAYVPDRAGNWASTAPFWFAIYDAPNSDGDVDNWNGIWYTDSRYVEPIPADSQQTLNAGDARLTCNSGYSNYYWKNTGLPVGDKYYICAPAKGEILTSHYACDYGHNMEYSFDVSTIDDSGNVVRKTCTMSITGAYCWYCCRNKSPEHDGDGNEYFTANTSDSLKGKVMSAGCLLCVGTADTKISFVFS